MIIYCLCFLRTVDSVTLTQLYEGHVSLVLIRKSAIDGERYCILCPIQKDFSIVPVMYYKVENEGGIPYGLPMQSPESAYLIPRESKKVMNTIIKTPPNANDNPWVIIMAVSARTVISFGLVAIPIAMYTATQDNDISFNQLHKEDNQRIRYKKVCGHCGKEVKSEDIVKGYQYDKDHYVIVTDEELEKIKTEKEKSIQILHFANLNQISPIYYDKCYHVVPEAGGDKAFELLRRALMEEQKIAIGKTVLGSHETLMAIIPREDGMLIATMHYADEIKDIPKSYARPETSEQELTLARTLISSMDTPFDPAAYHDEYQVKLRKLIEDKIAGKGIVATSEENNVNVIDLMDALKASIEQQRPVVRVGRFPPL